jgi:hypothetical protein
MKKSKLIKNKCEIESCNITDSALLEIHHHIDRTQENTTNNNLNLVILCPTHHAMIDKGLTILGIYPSTKLPNKRMVVYSLNGIQNIEGDFKPYCEFKNKSLKIYNKGI